jgi:ferrous iron transport protein A
MTNLLEFPVGKQARLASIGGERSFRRRLMEMGLLPGTPVRLVRRANMGGLLEVEVRGCYLSLRHTEAEKLLLESL